MSKTFGIGTLTGRSCAAWSCHGPSAKARTLRIRGAPAVGSEGDREPESVRTRFGGWNPKSGIHLNHSESLNTLSLFLFLRANYTSYISDYLQFPRKDGFGRNTGRTTSYDNYWWGIGVVHEAPAPIPGGTERSTEDTPPSSPSSGRRPWRPRSSRRPEPNRLKRCSFQTRGRWETMSYI